MERLDNCKNTDCGKKLIHTEGRRPKEFCSPECRIKFNNLKNKKGGSRGRPRGSKNKVNLEKLKQELAEERESRNNPLINAARGRDKSGVNEDEVKRKISVPAKENDNPLGLSPFMLARQKSKGGIK